MADYRDKSPDAGRMGKAGEHLVAASCNIGSRAKLNVSTSLVDDEGVALVFHRRGGTTTLAVQKGGAVRASSRVSAPPNLEPASLGTVWLVPSLELAKLVKPNRRGRLSFMASLRPASKDRWSQYRLTPAELPGRSLPRSISWML